MNFHRIKWSNEINETMKLSLSERILSVFNPDLLDKRIDQQLELKAQSIENKIHEALYRHIGNGTAVWSDQNFTSYIRNGYEANLYVYAIVSWIARKAAAMPFKVERYTKNGDPEQIFDHPIIDLLESPNDLQGQFEFFEQYYGFRLLTGNTFMYKLMPGAGLNAKMPQELYVLPANLTEIIASDNPMMPIKGYKLTEYWGKEFLPEEVMHSRYANYDYRSGREWYGMSPIMAALKVIDKSNESFNAGKRAFQNMGADGLIFPKNAPAPLTEEQVEQNQKRLDKKIRGSDNFKRRVLVSSEMGYLQFGMSPQELQLLEDAQITKDDLCSVWHLPGEVINNQKSSGLNDGARNTARKIAYQDAVLPEVQAFCDEFNRSVVIPNFPDIRICPDTSKIPELQADKVEQARWLGLSPHLTDNEKREVQGYGPIEGGDVLRAGQPMDLSITDGQGNNKGVLRILDDYYPLSRETGS